ncbi:peroxide stress protein YaaA, partial [Vibrio cholerae O1 biovar El Tor]
VPALRRLWAEATSAAIAAEAPPFILDLRSEAYVALGPVPATVPSAYVRVVTDQGRALNHFNKKSKGLLVRALAEDRPRIGSLRALRGWAE